MKSLKRVVVTGLGAITPLGNTATDFWQALVRGQNGAELITKFDTTHYKTKFACEVRNFDPLQYFDRKEARKLDTFSHFAVAAADEAIADAQLNNNPAINKDRVGVIIGSGIGGSYTFQEQVVE